MKPGAQQRPVKCNKWLTAFIKEWIKEVYLLGLIDYHSGKGDISSELFL